MLTKSLQNITKVIGDLIKSVSMHLHLFIKKYYKEFFDILIAFVFYFIASTLEKQMTHTAIFEIKGYEITYFNLAVTVIGYLFGIIVSSSYTSRLTSCPADMDNPIIINQIYDRIKAKNPGTLRWLHKLSEVYMNDQLKNYLGEEYIKNMSDYIGYFIAQPKTIEEYKSIVETFLDKAQESYYATCIFPARYWVSGDFLFNWYEFKKIFIFCWDHVPGKDDEKLIEFLILNYGFDWAKTPEISKNNDTITISTENESISLKLNDNKTEAILETDSHKTDKLMAKMEKNELNIYKESNEEDKKKIGHRLIDYFDSITPNNLGIDVSNVKYKINNTNTIKVSDTKRDLFTITLHDEYTALKSDYLNDEIKLYTRRNGERIDVFSGNPYEIKYYEDYFIKVRDLVAQDGKKIEKVRVLLTDVHYSKKEWEDDPVTSEKFDSYNKGVDLRIYTLDKDVVKSRFYGDLVVVDKKIALIYEGNKLGPRGYNNGRLRIITGNMVNKYIELFNDDKVMRNARIEPNEIWTNH